MKKTTNSIVLLHSIRRHKKKKKELKINKAKRAIKKKLLKGLKQKEESAFYHAKHLAAYMKINQSKLNVKSKKSIYKIELPKCFCLYEQPEAVLNLLKEVASLSEFKNITGLYIDHTKCIKHDLAAEILFASAVKSLDASKSKSFTIEGTLPKDEKMSRLLRSIGVVKDTAAAEYHESDDYLKLYKKRSEPREDIEKSIFEQDRKSAVTAGFTKYLNNCLELISSSLSKDEESKLTRYLGEVLGNAEDHSGAKLWQIVGYLDSVDPNHLYCEIVIVNIGKTFLETFMDKQESAVVNDKRMDYVRRHSMAEELLTLVYAMQQNASSKLDEEIDRGQGTKYFMELFHHLVDKNKNDHCNPKMLILSGGAILKMDGTYRSQISNDKVIYALNESNDLSKAPDKNYIKSLGEQKFPGAVIYIRYSLQETQELEKKNEI